MLEKLSIRFAAPTDLEFVHQDGYVAADIVRRKIEWDEVIVGESGGQLVGYLRFEHLWSIVPYIAVIRVLAEHRGRGVGGAMLHYLEEHSRGKGHGALYSSSQADEPEAQRWHRKMGFEECGLIAGMNEGGVGEVMFRKRLG